PQPRLVGEQPRDRRACRSGRSHVGVPVVRGVGTLATPGIVRARSAVAGQHVPIRAQPGARHRIPRAGARAGSRSGDRGGRGGAPRPAARPFELPDAGMTILRTPATDEPEIWVRCDGGPHGFLSIAAHAHADALSVEVRHGGVDVLADPGTYCYHGEPEWRQY